jgi:hypothetical protein
VDLELAIIIATPGMTTNGAQQYVQAARAATLGVAARARESLARLDNPDPRAKGAAGPSGALSTTAFVVDILLSAPGIRRKPMRENGVRSQCL